MSTKLKRWSTSNEIKYCDKFVKSHQSNNINNYIINTNVEALQDSNGRHIYMLDLNKKYENDHAFIDDLYD